MKKYAYLIVVIFTLIAALGVNLQIGQPLTPLSSISLEQVEALANTEQGENKVKCFGIGCIDCPINSLKVKYLD